MLENKTDFDVILSIIIPTFNHELYISKALDSVLMQKTKYKIEVLVGEDMSSDGTRDILKKYEKDFPNFFTIYYRDHNMHNDKICNVQDLYLRAKGRYVICLEGDDYWTYNYKIEKQIDFLENNPDYIATAHKCTVVDQNGIECNEAYLDCNDTEYSLNHFLLGVVPGQTATVMYRNYYRYKLFDTSVLEMGLVPGDLLKFYCLATNGKIYCMKENWSAYRHVLNGGSSFSANNHYDFKKLEIWNRSLYNYAKLNSTSFGIKITGALYLYVILVGVKKGELSFIDGVKIINNDLRNLPILFYYLLKRFFFIKFRLNKITKKRS